MSIIAITIQPNTESINAAYRPIVLRVQANAIDSTPIPPVVYCDIYFENVFYKTISKTQYELANDTYSEWQFDIQDACQEYLGKYLGQNGGTGLEEAAPLVVEVDCCFRSSGIDDNGFIQYEGTEPVQGTDSSDPEPGDGTQSNTFSVLNSTLQHEDNQVFTDHLNSYKTGTWDDDTYPLSHRPSCQMGVGQSDFFPIVTQTTFGGCDGGSLVIKYKLISDAADADYRSESASVGDVSCNGVVSDVNIVIDGSDATITWTGTGDIFNYSYSLDGGAAIEVDGTEIDLTGLSNGAHSISITPNCACSSGAAVVTDFNIDVECVAPSMVEDPLPDGHVGVPYGLSLDIDGTAPFTISDIVCPDWMTIEIVGPGVLFSGTPASDDVFPDLTVSFTITNDCGTFDYSSEVSVVASSGSDVSICVHPNLESVGEQLFIQVTADSPVPGAVTANITVHTQYETYTTTRSIASGGTSSANTKILYTSGNSDEAYTGVLITSFTPATEGAITYEDGGLC